jgi:uncharacterized protein YqhQ
LRELGARKRDEKRQWDHFLNRESNFSDRGTAVDKPVTAHNVLLFIVTLLLPFCCRHFVFFLVPILAATLHSRKRSAYLCTHQAHRSSHSNDKVLNQEAGS